MRDAPVSGLRPGRALESQQESGWASRSSGRSRLISVRWMFMAILASPAALAGVDEPTVPSDPHAWNADFQRVSPATPACAGGTIEALGHRSTLSQAYAPKAFEALHPGVLATRGLRASDRFYAFHFRSELPGGSFWAFGGYVVVRDTCIIHARVNTYDN